eukprot:3031529-Pyramimonas_sp.AAC.1
MISDLGAEHSLIPTPPSVLQVCLKEGVWRSLEREAARKYGSDGVESLCFDVVTKALRSKKFSARQTITIRCCACQGIWPYARARAAGYEVEDRCP